MADEANDTPQRWCYIDDCRKRASLVVESYPDDVTLCDDHRFIYDHRNPLPGDRVILGADR